MSTENKLNTEYCVATAKGYEIVVIPHNTGDPLTDAVLHAANLGYRLQEEDRLKAENLDLKRKLRDARAENELRQREYIDLLERRGK